MKYTLGDSKEVIDPNGGMHTVYQIIAAEDFKIPQGRSGKQIDKGTKGGWIENEQNLSQEGGCWILKENSFVVGNSRVYEDAVIEEWCWVMDDARVHGSARISFGSVISEHAEVFENASVDDHSTISGFAIIKGSAVVSNAAEVTEKACVDGRAIVSGDSLNGGKAVVRGKVHLTGRAQVYCAIVESENPARITGYALIKGQEFPRQ